jgi:peptide/nickel transport system permease protein
MVHGLLMRVTDAFLAFPVIAGVWLLQQVMQPAFTFAEPTLIQQAFHDLGLDPVPLALILFSWMPYARLTSASIGQLKHSEYIQAARSLGMRNTRIIRRHLLPNALPSVIVLAARDVGAMVILASAFTFIGLGASTEWGMLLVVGRDYVIGFNGNPLTYWWVFVPATLAMILFGVGWNLLGDGLNSLLDPYG